MILREIIYLLLSFFAGLCDGVIDSIEQYDGYSRLGYFWSFMSWKDKKLFGQFVVNAWHVFKFTMILLLFYKDNWLPDINLLDKNILITAGVCFFIIGFNLTHKKKV